MTGAWPPEWLPADDVGSECSGREQTGTRTLLEVLLDASDSRSLGIYACRESTGGGGLSVHAEGRAIDLQPADWTHAHPSAEGERILVRLGEQARPLGIQRVIWWERVYDRHTPLGRHYSGPHPHHDHLHIEQTWAAARTLTREAAEAALLPHDDPSEANTMIMLRRWDDLTDTFRWLYVDGRRWRANDWSSGPGPVEAAGVPTWALTDAQLSKIPEV